MRNPRIVHYATNAAFTGCAQSSQPGAERVGDWSLVTCSECLAYRAGIRRKQIIVGVAVAAALMLLLITWGVRTIVGDSGAPETTQAEIDQTIVAQGIQATLQSMSQTREHPTRQAMRATQTVVAATTIPQTRRARAASQTRTALQATQTARNAPAPYSIKVRGTEVVCREIAYEYVYMVDLGKIAALQHVANTITLRSNNPTAYFSAHDAENALVDCKCLSPRNCKPIQ